MNKINRFLLRLIGINISYDQRVYAKTKLAVYLLDICVEYGSLIKDNTDQNFYKRIKNSQQS